MGLLHSKTLLVTGAITAASLGFFKLLDGAAKATDELEDSAAAIGVTTDNLLAAQLAGARVGSSAEVVTKGMERVSRMMGEARKSADQLTQSQGDLRTGMNVLVSSGGEVLGTFAEMSDLFIKPVKNVTDFTNAFTELGIDLTTFAPTAEGIGSAMAELARRLDGLSDATQKARLAQSVFGREWPKQIELLKDYERNLAEAKQTVDQYGLAVSKAESQQSAAWLRAFNTFSFVFERIKTIVGDILAGSFAPFFDGLTKLLGENQSRIREWAEGVGVWLKSVATDFVTLISGGPDTEVKNRWILTLRDDLIALKDVAAATLKVIQALQASWRGDPVPPPPQDFSGEVGVGEVKLASGGYIRGRGTGRSDSILARVSNGEFVVNADSVRRLGVGYLQALNSFATGGLVHAPLSFADGGLVSSGGRPVHLHLGSSSFALSGSSGVVDALVSHAHGQQMRSAGVKPSWFAGRPSGR
jgi:hypothetical protein